MTPSTLRAAAARLQAAAASLPSALDGVAAAAGPEVWRGPAASRFAVELRENRRKLAGAADELRAASRRLLARAEALEEQERERRAALAGSGG